MRQLIKIFWGLLLLLSVGLVHGWWTQRWQRLPAVETAVQRLDGVPTAFGSWEGKPIELPAEHLKRAGAEGYRLQSFTSRRNPSMFSTILLCGRSGPMTVHRPEHCYPGAGYDLSGMPVHYAVTSPDGKVLGRFYTARFVKEDVTGSRQLRIFWSWFDGEEWTAPEYPRWKFASLPYLYKLYVIHEIQHRSDSLDDDPTVAFLQQFLPRLTESLKPQSR